MDRKTSGSRWDGRLVFGLLILILLAGYLFLDKSFAYIGAGPVYVSEFGLGIGFLAILAAAIQKKLDWSRLRSWPLTCLAGFLSWSFLRTIPYLASNGLDAARDAVVWGYAAYAIFLILLIPKAWLEWFLEAYGKVLPLLLVWWIAAFFLSWFTALQWNPFIPDYSLFRMKPGDVCVHLTGMAAYLLLGIRKSWNAERRLLPEGLTWLLWWTAWILYGTISRAAMLAPLLGLLLVCGFAFRPPRKWIAPLLSAVLILAALYITDIHLPIPDPTRHVDVSFDQVVTNFRSLLGDDTLPVEESRILTIRWRMDWWHKIYDYTIGGTYAWGGKGYGINLADDDGFQVMPDHSLRSPHNVFMTILARSGVPGLALWVLFLASIGMMLFANGFGRQGSDAWKRHAVFFLVYIFAFLFNASFDVYLEGPMGGIWFWCLIGAACLYFDGQKDSPGKPTAAPPAAR